MLSPAHDQFAPPYWVGKVTRDWPEVTVETVPMADHFLAGATGQVARAVTEWVSGHALSPGSAG